MTLKGYKPHFNVKFLKGYGHSISVKNSKIILKDCHDPFSPPEQEEWFVKNMPYSKIVLSGKGYISTEALALLSKNNRNVILLDTHGKPITFMNGMMVPPWTGPDGILHDKPPIVGIFSIEKIIVSEKEYYKIISIILNIKAENLELGDMVFLSPIAFTLKSEQGKVYVNQPKECSSPISYQITGKTGPNLSVAVCYEVEKELDRFDVFFRSENHQNYKIGSFTL